MRKSYMQPGSIFFFTATIHKWIPLLADDYCKEIVLSSFKNLSERGLLEVYAFVIMPNHVHVIWKTTGLNGKETVQGSFLKYTAHAFRKHLTSQLPEKLEQFRVNASNKQFEFWKRDSLAIHLYSPEVAYQKLEYIHRNPLASHWNLATSPEHYKWSSASYYHSEETEFLFLKNIRTALHGI
jgi:putative transposase